MIEEAKALEWTVKQAFKNIAAPLADRLEQLSLKIEQGQDTHNLGNNRSKRKFKRDFDDYESDSCSLNIERKLCICNVECPTHEGGRDQSIKAMKPAEFVPNCEDDAGDD
uniref:Uncharacterized protein n=1 Tax=Romanomermis culicivorax TaxID=13658 RepID=A0A915J675_ROMCU